MSDDSAPQLAERLRQRLRPSSVFARHASRARRVGLEELYLVLSFDCDTEEDIEVAPEVHERLLELGVRPVYAVPGELLRRGEGVYGRFAETGSEFLNHGGREHTYFDEDLGRHASCFFYDQQDPEVVDEDIRAGDAIVREVVGIAPRGFRTPHFGTYQQAHQLESLHVVLTNLGYRFSTSTVPAYGMRYGPAFDRFGVTELPVSGLATSPFEILDTWACFEAPDRVRTPADFRDQAERLASAHKAAGPGLINIYGDPSHVHGEDDFFEGIAALAAVAEPVGYDDILGRLR